MLPAGLGGDVVVVVAVVVGVVKLPRVPLVGQCYIR